MPSRQDRWEESSSSESDHSSSSSRSHQGGRRRVQFGSSCGIRSVNEYQDRILNKNDPKKAESYAETDNSLAWAGAKATDHRNGHFSSAAYSGAAALKERCHSVYKATAEASAEFGLGGAIADAGADARVYNFQNDEVDVDVGKGYVGGGLGLGAGGAKAKVEAGVDLVDVNLKLSENQSFDCNVGLNADTGAEIGVDGVSASFLGFGVSAGRKTGLSTPFGGLSFKLW